MSDTKGIKIVLHPVTDVAAAKRVYTALLGIQPQADSEYYVGYDTPTQHIGLLPGGGPQGYTSPVAFWEVSDLDGALQQLTDAGATVREPASEVGPGRRVASVTDADGNVLGLVQDS